MRQIFKSITQRLQIPIVCAICNQFHRDRTIICLRCEPLLVPLNHACRVCALPLFDEHFPLCGHCIKRPPAFDSVMTAYRFEGPLRALVHQFKYQQALYLLPLLASLMLQAQARLNHQPGLLIPIPLHRKRICARGFNQAAELTKYLAKTLKCPYSLFACQKTINTPPQVGMDRQQRQRNLKHSFQITGKMPNHVTLIDDILTTGSTANELAKTLKAAGVLRVDVWCCARAC